MSATLDFAERNVTFSRPATPMKNRKLSDALKAKWASGTRKKNPPGTQEKSAATLRAKYASGELTRPVLSAELRAQIGRKVSEKLKGRATRGEWTEEQRAHQSHLARSNPVLVKGENNCKARMWRVRSPENVVYVFKNLQEFIRNNPHLFNEEDVIWKPNIKAMRCNASAGIEVISPRRKHPAGSWKGWTWHHTVERVLNQGRDLLERQTA